MMEGGSPYEKQRLFLFQRCMKKYDLQISSIIYLVKLPSCIFTSYDTTTSEFGEIYAIRNFSLKNKTMHADEVFMYGLKKLKKKQLTDYL